MVVSLGARVVYEQVTGLCGPGGAPQVPAGHSLALVLSRLLATSEAEVAGLLGELERAGLLSLGEGAAVQLAPAEGPSQKQAAAQAQAMLRARCKAALAAKVVRAGATATAIGVGRQQLYRFAEGERGLSVDAAGALARLLDEAGVAQSVASDVAPAMLPTDARGNIPGNVSGNTEVAPSSPLLHLPSAIPEKAEQTQAAAAAAADAGARVGNIPGNIAQATSEATPAPGNVDAPEQSGTFRCGSVEPLKPNDALALLEALGTASGGRVHTQAAAALQGAFGRVCREAGYTLETMATLGAWLTAGGASTMRRALGVSLLVGKPDAQGAYAASTLSSFIDDAEAWKRAGGGPVKPQGRGASASPIARASTPEQHAAARAPDYVDPITRRMRERAAAPANPQGATRS